MKKSDNSLTEDEIEEEFVNRELIDSGDLPDETSLDELNLQQKKELLKKINESKEDMQSQARLLSSIQGHSLAPLVGKNNSVKKLKLPRKQLYTTKDAAGDTIRNTVRLDTQLSRNFNLPGCLDDGTLPLPLPERPRCTRLSFCVMDGETSNSALKRMLAEHNKWKDAYQKELRGLEPQDISYVEVVKADGNILKENHPPLATIGEDDLKEAQYDFESNSPLQKENSGSSKRETKTLPNDKVQNSRQMRTLQRKASRDSDCEDNEAVMKPANPKIGDWIQTTTRAKSKRNKKQNNQEKARPKSVEGNLDVDFDFNKTWDGQSTAWKVSQSPSLGPTPQPRRLPSSPPAVEEQPVQCPICQKRFPITKVESHAANCMGFSDSMEVEEN